MKSLKLIKPEETKAILIGVSEFDDKNFVNAAPIKRNVEKLAALLQDENILGLKKKNILVLNENRRHDEILKSIDDFLETGFTDTAIFYFAGHGYKTNRGDFYLVTKNTNKGRIKSSAIHWDEIKETFETGGKGIQQRLYILDACHSGAAALGEEDDETRIEEGSALIAAAKADAKAYFNATDEYTHFTNAFINVLENGVDQAAKSDLDTNLLFEKMEAALKDEKFEITKKMTHKINEVSFFKNKRFDKLSVKRREIINLIKKGDNLLAALDFEKAEFNYLKAERLAKPKDKFQALIQQIDDKIRKAEDIESYQKIFEAHFAKQVQEKEQQLAQQQEHIKTLQSEITEKQQRLAANKTTIAKDAKTIKQLQKDKTTLEKSLTEEKQALKKAQVEITKLQATVRQDQAIYKKLLQEKNSLQKELHKIKNPPKPKTKNFTEKIGNTAFDLIFIKGGTFKMGSDNQTDEKPIHNVNVPDFYLAELEVTQELWQEVMGNNPSNFKGDNNPVEQVSWNDAQEFIKKLNAKTGKKYRLPSEAEWEFAARGGVSASSATGKGYKYAGSNNIDEVAEYEGNNDKRTKPVGGKKANELGLYDMSGNVWEWCQDKWHDNYATNAPDDGSAWESGNSSSRVIRGGSWFSLADYCRVAYRYNYGAVSRDSYLGFRIASSLPREILE